MRCAMLDLVIIGAGPAGLSAAVYAARAGLSVMMLESSMYGGQITSTPEVENYPSVKKISGWELAQSFYEQASDLGAKLEFETVEAIEDCGDYKRIKTSGAEYEAKAVIIANGAKRRKLDCPGEEELSGCGVSYCASCDGSFFKGKTAAVVGGGNTALEDALYLSNICEKVYLIHRRDEFRAENHLIRAVSEKGNIIPVLSKIPEKVIGENSVTAIEVKDVLSGESETISTDCVFVCIGLKPDNSAFGEIIELDPAGYIRANEDCKTSCPGIFAAGDTRTKALRQIVTAAADGAVAATAAAAYVNSK